MSPRRRRTPETVAGNIFIYIIGAIFLMGILVVLLRGNMQEGSGIDRERTALTAVKVQAYAAALQRGVTNVMRNGYSEGDIRFAHPSADAGYGTITDTPARQVFDPKGGDVRWQAAPDGAQTATTPWVISGRNQVTQIGRTCAQAACADLIAILPNITKDLCLSINAKNGIANPSGNPPANSAAFNITGLYSGAFAAPDTISDGAAVPGHPEGCVEGSGTPAVGTYHYYRVLMPR